MALSHHHETWWVDLGTEDYGAVLALQHALAVARRAGAVPDVVLLVEHHPVITLGRAADPAHVLASEAELAAAGIGVHRVERGGDVTYHGPGQLVCYPIVDLAARGRDVHGHARRLEEVMIRAAGAFGVRAFRDGTFPGVWCAQGKLGAIGFAVRRWVTTHGAALNVGPRMAHYELVVPCGIQGRPVTSLERVVGRPLDMRSARRELAQAYADVFSARLVARGRDGMASLLDKGGALTRGASDPGRAPTRGVRGIDRTDRRGERVCR